MKFSIVVPMYNAMNNINATLNSLLNQDFLDYEIVLVDDGSTDGTYDFCKKKSQENDKIKLIKKANGGVSSARNCGIDNAKGEYILFVDSDDILEENALSTYNDFLETSPDLIISGYEQINVDSGDKFIHKYDEKWQGSKQEYLSKPFEKLFDNWLIHCPWNKVYKRDIILKNNIRFSEDYSIYEDIGFVLDYSSFCENIVIIPNILYEYIVKSQGSLVSKFHENAYIAYLDCYSRLKTLLKDNEDSVMNNKFKYFSLTIVFGYLKSLYKNKNTNAYKIRKVILKEICQDERMVELLETNYENLKPHHKIEKLLMKNKCIVLLNLFLRIIYFK